MVILKFMAVVSFVFMDCVYTVDLIDESDFNNLNQSVKTETPVQGSSAPASGKPDIIESINQMTNLSARERNKLKRKARMAAKEKGRADK
jgi:hypothetical protein